MGEEGLSASEKPNQNGRDELGRFAKGNPGGPGRPNKEMQLAMLDAINASLSPEDIQAYIREAMDYAREHKSPRAMVNVLEFAANYALGKPTQRIIQEQGGLGELADELGIDLSE